MLLVLLIGDVWGSVRGERQRSNERRGQNTGAEDKSERTGAGAERWRGASWLSGKFGALRPEGSRFKSHSSHHIGTIGKSFTQCCL